MTTKLRQLEILELCEAALELAPNERTAWLAKRCDSNDALLSDVLTLLERAERDDDLLTTNLMADVKPGDHIGRYELIEVCGHGGMGTVYRARRRDASFEQVVALKVLRAEIVTQALRQRFDLERRALARLHHPYIAGMIDGGTTDKGLPWLVMEYVEGVPIDQHCNDRRLNVGERLALLEKVAMAVQHAHQNLVIHRDLKPSNVLVNSDGIPKLVDFGIAKLIELPDEHTGEENVQGITTLYGQRALTPDFASPEQILDGRVSTSSDIYSLGVLTMLVLTGRKPYELDTKTPRSLLESLGRITVPRVSEMVSRHADVQTLATLAQQRRVSPARLRRLFRGDADAIMGTALHPEPVKRYVSADAFREDLQRYRLGQPVVARNASLLTRSLALVRSHKLMFSVVAATVAALSVGLVIALWQARIAERRFADLHEFSRVVLGDVYDSIANLPGSTDARREITQAAQHYLDKLAGSDMTLVRQRLKDDQLLQDLALAYRRLGDVQGDPTNANLGESTLALENYRRALQIVEQIRTESPQAMSARAQIHRSIADVMSWQGDKAPALEQLKVAHTLMRALVDADRDNQAARVNLVYSHVKIGDLLGHPSFPNLGDSEGAAAMYAKGLTLFDRTAPVVEERDLGRSHGVLLERSGTMAMVHGDVDRALAFYLESAEVRRALAQNNAGHTDIQRDAGVAVEMIADVLKRRGDLPAALEKYREALQVYRGLAEVDARNANAQRTLAIGLENLAEALVLDQRNERAAQRYAEAVEIREHLVALDPASERLRKELERTQVALSVLFP
ncbi:MAG: protein kinase [Gammaproteobacteria bacterium]